MRDRLREAQLTGGTDRGQSVLSRQSSGYPKELLCDNRCVLGTNGDATKPASTPGVGNVRIRKLLRYRAGAFRTDPMLL
jgi:hypothetical protein